MKVSVALLVLFVALPGAAGQDDAAAEIQGLYAEWRRAVETADIPLYVSVLAEDVKLIPPGGEVIDGSAGYEAFLGPVFEAATYAIEVVEPPQVEVHGDFALAEYRYVIHLTLKDPGQGVDQPGALTNARTHSRYFDVLRKTGGSWKVWRHLWQELD